MPRHPRPHKTSRITLDMTGLNDRVLDYCEAHGIHRSLLIRELLRRELDDYYNRIAPLLSKRAALR